MRAAGVAILAAVLGGCAGGGVPPGGPGSASSVPPAEPKPRGDMAGLAEDPHPSKDPYPSKDPSRDPYPSTYAAPASAPTLIRGATIYDGEGRRIDGGSLLMTDGRVAAVGPSVQAPPGARIIEAAGKWVTPGIIDAHSHLGAGASPEVSGMADVNESTAPVHADVWVEHSVWPQDPGFIRALMNGGVTSLHILPGSANLFGGRGVTLKNVRAITMQAMKFPGAPYTLKMACGENPKRVYGQRKGAMPGSRMGNLALNRQTWADAVRYKHQWESYEERARAGRAEPKDAPRRELGNETLTGVLDGRILVQNHCYRADEMAVMIDLADEFGYRIAAFHHAVEAYKIAPLLAERGICAAMWADWWGFKMESYDGIRENIPFVHAAGGCAIVHSDDPNGIQRLNQEAAKALADGRRAGIDIAPEVAWTWLSLNPAKALGIDRQTGSLVPGKMADAVLWNGDPLSVYSRPEKVWIDGALAFDALDPASAPVSDFELGQPGRGRR